MRGRSLQAEVLSYTKGVIGDDDSNKLDVVEFIELAGRTAYKSHAKITRGSAEKFVRAIRERGHESVMEHSWFTFALDVVEREKKHELIAKLFLANHLFSVTERDGVVLLSGNARMFRDFFRSDYWAVTGQERDPLRHALLKVLNERYPVLFEDLGIDGGVEVPEWVRFNNDDGVSEKEFTQRREKEKHWWALVKFTGGSRSFTHQFVRHRHQTAFTQESQRYLDGSGFFENNYFSVPLCVRQAPLFFTGKGTTLEDWWVEKQKIIDEWYQKARGYFKEAKAKGLITTGKVNEDARFFLPNAVCSEIVCSAPLGEWRWIFRMRTAADVQWEIRSVMLKLLRKFQFLFPGVFDDFQIDEKKATASLIIKEE